MTTSPMGLLLLPRRSAAVRWPYLVGAGSHRRRSAPVAVLLLRAAGRAVIAPITLMAARAEAHYYQDCGDPDCMMFGCRAYKTGYRDGYARGFADGYAAGFSEGVAAGGRN